MYTNLDLVKAWAITIATAVVLMVALACAVVVNYLIITAMFINTPTGWEEWTAVVGIITVVVVAPTVAVLGAMPLVYEQYKDVLHVRRYMRRSEG